MTERTRWQFCQIEVGTNSMGMLRQFFPERTPVETNLHQNWPLMLAKLGDQGWELVSVFPNEGGRGRSPLTYVLKRPLPASSNAQKPIQTTPSATPPSQPPDPPEQPQGPQTEFEPLDLS